MRQLSAMDDHLLHRLGFDQPRAFTNETPQLPSLFERIIDWLAQALSPLQRLDAWARRVPRVVPVTVWLIVIFGVAIGLGAADGSIVIGVVAALYWGVVMPIFWAALWRYRRRRSGRGDTGPGLVHVARNDSCSAPGMCLRSSRFCIGRCHGGRPMPGSDHGRCAAVGASG